MEEKAYTEGREDESEVYKCPLIMLAVIMGDNLCFLTNYDSFIKTPFKTPAPDVKQTYKIMIFFNTVQRQCICACSNTQSADTRVGDTLFFLFFCISAKRAETINFTTLAQGSLSHLPTGL